MSDEKEYIERGALIRFVKQNTPNIHGDTTMRCVERALKAAPASADMVEVVRCKDCLHGQKNNFGQLKGRYVCEYHQDYKPMFDPYHYCSYGERKEQT